MIIVKQNIGKFINRLPFFRTPVDFLAENKVLPDCSAYSSSYLKHTQIPVRDSSSYSRQS
jgi:hypothetical protein